MEYVVMFKVLSTNEVVMVYTLTEEDAITLISVLKTNASISVSDEPIKVVIGKSQLVSISS